MGGLLIFVCENGKENNNDEVIHYLVLGDECVCELAGEVYEAEVGLSTSLITLPSTLIGTHGYTKVTLQNLSYQTVKFNWTLENATQNISLQPTTGILNPQTEREIIISFNPDKDNFTNTTALCIVTGRKDPLKLKICGRGRAPNIEFSFTNMDTGNILVTTPRTFELVLQNKSEAETHFTAQTDSENLQVFPSEGKINAYRCQTIRIRIHSTRLGQFKEKIGFEFAGSSKIHSIDFSGEITAPEIISEPKYLDFGDVAFDYGVSKVLKLINKSPLCLPIKLQVNEVEGVIINKSAVCLEKQEATLIELIYLASEEGFREGNLAIIMESVGKILEIPIRARCCIPRIKQSVKSIKLESCFINHPKAFQIEIDNPANISAKYRVLAVETKDVKIIPISSAGVLPPITTTFVKFNFFGKNVGNLTEKIEISIVGAEYKPLIFEITCECVGPVLSLNTKCVDFGEIAILTPFLRVMELLNISPIPANVICYTVKKSANFEVSPQRMIIPPFAKVQVEITAFVKVVGVEVTDVVEISTGYTSSLPWKVDLRAISIGDLISVEPELKQSLEMGQQFVNLPQIYEFKVNNCSYAQQRLVWTIENVQKMRRDDKRKESKADDFEILLNPQKIELKSSQCVNFSLKISSSRRQKIQFILQCHSVLANKGHKKLLRECRVSAEFIEPMISIIPNPVEFYILKERGKNIENQCQNVSVINEADIETSVNLAISEPLFIVEDGQLFHNLELSINRKELRNITIGFAANSTSSKCLSYSVLKQLNLSFLNHPLKMKIPVFAQVYFPNLQITEKMIDFGSIQNGSSLIKSVTLYNNNPIEAKYEWKLTNGSVKDNPSEPLRIPKRAKSLEGLDAYNADIRRCSSISNIDSLHFKDIFSVSPPLGSIKPGESVSTDFKFVGHHDLTAKCTATCKIIDGMDLEIDLIGQSSTSDCYITATSLSFTDILFSEEATRIFRIYNAGKVTCPFYFTWDKNDLSLKIDPSEGEVPAKGVTEVVISVTVPRPQEFTVFAKVHLAKLTSKSIRFYGKACFPHFKFKSLTPSDSDYVYNDPCEFAASLTANKLDYPLKLPTVRLDLSDMLCGETKSVKIEYVQTMHRFASVITIDKAVKRLLAENGLTITIGREIKVVFDSSKTRIGEVILDIPLKIHEKVIQPIQVHANIVPLELRVNPREIDFGDVYLNEARIIAVQLHNPTPFQLSWDLPATEISGRSIDAQPKYGRLNPDQKENVYIKFHPRTGDAITEEIKLRIKGSESISAISCQGKGLEPRLIFNPKRIEFTPLKSNGDYDEKSIVIRNPCNFDVEFYSADFAEAHIQENNILESFPLFQESEEILIPPRKPGEELPKEMRDMFAQMQKSGTGKIKSSRLRSSHRGLTKASADPTKSPQISNITTFKKFVEESCVMPNSSGIVILVFGSPQSGKTDLAVRLAEIYDASYLDIQEFLETHTQEISLEGSLAERVQRDDCKFALIVDNIETFEFCKMLFRCFEKRMVSVFAVTVTRDIESIQLADKRYEEGLKRAEKEAFEMNVIKYKAMAEWEYNNLPEEERKTIDQTLAKWKRQRRKNEMSEPIVETSLKKSTRKRQRGKAEPTASKDPETLKYAELEQRITEFKKEHRAICQFLSTWDLKTHEQTSNKPFQQPINLDLSETTSITKSHEDSIGIPHFFIQSKLDCELNDTITDPIVIKNGEVSKEKPNIAAVVDKLLSNLPRLEEIKQTFGYGPLEFRIPEPVTYEVVRKSSRSYEQVKKTIFTIANPTGLFKTVGTMDTPRSSSRMSVVSQYGRSASRNSLSKEKKLLEQLRVQDSEQAASYRWIVPANEQIELTIRFSPPKQGIFKDVLKFTLARTNSCLEIECQGCCQVPRLIADPNCVFSTVEARCPSDKFLRKSYLLERNRFEFGTLLASKSRDKILIGEYKENTAKLQFTNEGPHDVEVAFDFEENEGGHFAVAPSELSILKNEAKAISVFALPSSVASVTGTLIGRIKNNPEPIVFHFAAEGVLPNLSIQTRAIEFGRLPLNYTEKQTVCISNPTVIPISWKIEKIGAVKNMGLKVYPSSGILQVLNEEASVTVEYTSPSIQEAVLIKEAFRFTVTDIRELCDPIVVKPYITVQAEAVDPNFKIGLLKDDGIDFGLLKLGDKAKKTIELRNGGPFKLRYKFVKAQLQDFRCPFELSSDSGNLQPGQNIPITISCDGSQEMDISRNIFTCVVETYREIPIASVPIPIKAQIRRSQFKLIPSKMIAFGAIATNAKISELLAIENIGPFDLRYSITTKNSIEKLKSNFDRPRPLNTKSNNRFCLVPFTIQPASGIISIGKKIEIQIECSAGSSPSSHDEELVINISDRATTNKIYYRLSVEVVAPVLKFDNKLSIFEEHLICKTREEFEILTSNTVPNPAYIEEENCFDFGISQLETTCKSKFKFLNNSKIPIDVEFHIQSDQISNRGKGRRSDNDESDSFKIFPSQCFIEPFQDVYLDLSFSPNSLQTFSAKFQAFVKGQNPNLPLFGVQGRGVLPQICIVEPSRNSSDEYWLVFDEKRNSNLMVLKNAGLIPCEVLVNIEETGNEMRVFKFNEGVNSNCPEVSTNIWLGVGEARTVEVIYNGPNYHSDEEIKGAVQITIKGNAYEKFVIKLLRIKYRKLTTPGPIEVLNLKLESDKQHLDLGTCHTGSSIYRSFLLNYPKENSESTNDSSYYFRWLIDDPHLEFEPKSGELKPGSLIEIIAKFHSDKSIKYRLSPVQCELYPLPNLEIMETSNSGSVKANAEDGAITARSAATQRSEMVVENPTEEKEVDRILLEVLFSVTCDFVEYECNNEVIEFPETPLHCESVQTLQIMNTGSVVMCVNIEMIEEPYYCGISRCVIDPGNNYELSLQYRPTHSRMDQGELVLRFQNTKDESRSVKKIQLLGKAYSIPLYFQLSKSDYQPKFLPIDPLWNEAQTFELTATGIGNKCIRSFTIKNASEESVEIKIDRIKCVKHGGMSIRLSEIGFEPGCSNDVIVEFSSRTMEPEECFVIFEANGFRVPLIIIGRTREAIAAFDKSHIDFENVLIGRTATRFVNLVNTEEIPINFKIDKTTLRCNESADKLTISPLNGLLQPKEKLPIKIGFSPKEERNCNYNIICEVDYRERPLRLNVKTNVLKYSISAWLLGEDDDSNLSIGPTLEQVNANDISKFLSLSSQKLINSSTLLSNLPIVDFGEVFARCEQTRMLKLINQSKFEINFVSSIYKTIKEAPEIFVISPTSGKIPPLKTALVEIKFCSKSVFEFPLQRAGFLGVIGILNGPAFAVDLRGHITLNPVEIAPKKLDFGPFFIQQVGLGCTSKNLEILNRSSARSIYITYASSTLPEFECDLTPQIIEPLSSVKTNVTFSPLLCKKYEGSLCFQLNERVKITIPVSGKGVKLNLEVKPGKLIVNQKGEKVGKVVECGKKEASDVNLGELTAFQSSRCVVLINNKTSVPLEISAAAILPKSKQLNEVHCEPSNNQMGFADVINMQFLKCQASSWKFKNSETPFQNCGAFPKETVTGIEIFFNPQGKPIDPFTEEIMLRVLTKSDPEKQVWIRGFQISGKCAAVSVVAETSTVNLGTVVAGSSLVRCVAVTNHGNKLARFVWNDKTVPRNILSIEPWKGYIQSGSSVNFKFSFKHDLKDGEILLRDVTCNIENSNPLKFIIIGTIATSSDSEVIKFSCPVRSTSTHTVTLSNPTNSWWSIKPVFNGSAWSGETIFEIPPKGTKDYVINYHPQSMTQNGVPLKAQVFFPLQNGKGLIYNLEGTAGPPEPILSKTGVEFSRGQKFDLSINVPNWLPKLQRFSVSWKTSDETNFTFTGSMYFDIPGGKSKIYVLACFAKIEASTDLKVIFTNQQTGEYQFVEYHIRSIKPKPEGVIELKSPLRKASIYYLELNNPFDKETVIGLRSSLPELICPPEYTIRPLTRSKIKLKFKPWRVGKLKGVLEVDGKGLGQSIYDLQLEALDPLPEGPVKFKTSVGKVESNFVTICNPSQSRVIFTCEINDLSFHCDKSILLAANSSAQLAVTFEPTQLGSKEATLKVSSNQIGSFMFQLCGLATPPEPQGPFIISAASPTQLKVKNIFSQSMKFKIKTNNANVLVECDEEVVKPQEELKMNISLRNRKSMPLVHGIVIVTTDPSSNSLKPIEWIFYVKSSH
nr:hydrocephalus inducing protein [Hymenolepis microstoma]